MADDELQPGQVFTSPSKTLTDAHFLFFSGLDGRQPSHPLRRRVRQADALRQAAGPRAAPGVADRDRGVATARPRSTASCSSSRARASSSRSAVGDTIHPTHRWTRVDRTGSAASCRLETSITNQRGETVLEGFHVYQIIPRRGGRRDAARRETACNAARVRSITAGRAVAGAATRSCPAVRVGNMVFISGTTGTDEGGSHHRAGRHRRADAPDLPQVRAVAPGGGRFLRRHRLDHRLLHHHRATTGRRRPCAASS